MKKELLMISLVFMFVFSVGFVVGETECTDSDGSEEDTFGNYGSDYFKKGTTSGLNLNGEYMVETDFCQDENNLAEYFCLINNNRFPNVNVDYLFYPAYKIECEFGCKDGACIEEEGEFCFDSDGGRESYYIKGYAEGDTYTGEKSTINDGCIEGGEHDGQLREAICDGSKATWIDYSCPNGCDDGACIKGSIEEVCIDSDEGESYYIQGNAKGNTYAGEKNTINDGCVEGQLREAICNNGRVTWIDYSCLNGCKDGACLESASTCTDSDRGQNITVYGESWMADNPDLKYKDSCQDANTLSEAMCTNDKFHYRDIDCPEGYICNGGVCIDSSLCTDTDGDDFYNKGITTGVDYLNKEQRVSIEDYCTKEQYGPKVDEGTFIHEQFCFEEEGKKYVYFEVSNCPNGCEDGVCIWREFTITEIPIGEEISASEIIERKCKSPSSLTYEQIKCMNDVIGDESQYEGIWVCDADEFALLLEYNGCKESQLSYVTYNCVIEKFPELKFNLKECGIKEIIIPTEETKITEEQYCVSCLMEDKCYPFNYRKKGKYCDLDKEFVSQLEAGEVCENNFECSSNLCIDNECLSGGFFRKIINWFKKLFG